MRSLSKVGVAADERLIYLLDLAMSTNKIGTVRRVTKLIGCGIESIALMPQLRTLIMNISATSCKARHNKCKGIFFHGYALRKATWRE